MSETGLLCWREAMRVWVETRDMGRLAEYLARLPEEERTSLLAGIDCDGLTVAVHSLLKQRQEQLALVLL